LLAKFLAWLRGEVRAGRNRPRTLAYYREQLGYFVSRIGRGRKLADLVAYDLERVKRGWHSVQAVQRLFNWGVNVGLIACNPFSRVAKGSPGERERIVSPEEFAAILRVSRPHFRRLLLATRWCMARPQEIRALRWLEWRPDIPAFSLAEFKAKHRRKDGVKARIIPVCPQLRRLIEWLDGRRKCKGPFEHVFLRRDGKPWTKNAIRLAVRRACKRAGLDIDDEEHIVLYTLRHTAATEGSAAGLSDGLLAGILGHASTRTVARYKHLQARHLVEGITLANRRRKTG
jgi:integrase